MTGNKLKSLITVSLFAGSLLGSIVYADDQPMDSSMPMNTPASAKGTDTSMPMDNKMNSTKPMKHHKKHKKAMNKDMGTDSIAKPADGQKMGGM